MSRDPHTALIIDTVSSARALSGDELRRWAAEHSAFLSSEMEQLGPEREAVARALRDLGMRVVAFEDLGGRDENPERAYLDGVAAADVYLGVIADRYGTMLPTGRSPTHEEYREARRRGKRISVWVQRDGDKRQGDARDFVSEVRTFHTTGGFTDPADLAQRVVGRVAELAADDESPWVKVGDAVFRAHAIRDTGDAIEIEATVREGAVARYLEGLRVGEWGRNRDIPVTTSDRAGEASIEEVISETRSQSTREMKIRARVHWGEGRGTGMDAGIQGLTADELTAIGLKCGLFGERPPEQLGMLSSMVDQTDPLEALVGESIPEGSVEPIARLLLVERLVGSGKASTVDSVDIGPMHDRRRRLRLAYTGPRRYSNEVPEQCVIEGDWSG